MTPERFEQIKLMVTSGIGAPPSGLFGNLALELVAEVERLRAQNASLLNAAKLLSDGLDTYWITTNDGTVAVSIAQAAIAQAETAT